MDTRTPWRRARATVVIAIAAVVSLVVMSCRVATDDMTVTGSDDLLPRTEIASGLPAVGPVPGSSHWHAAYVVRICDEVLPPFDAEDDPLGIHSHGDGVMHVHPFVESAGYESASLALFADAVGLGLRDGELTLPSGGVWRDGDLCNGVPSRVFVDRWSDPDPESPVERIFVGLDELRYEADGELYQIAFAPADSFPVVPPSAALLPEVSNLSPLPEPWVDAGEPSSLERVQLWEVGGVATAPCGEGQVPERVTRGPIRCFERSGVSLPGVDAVMAARAVMFNRQPAVEIRMAPALIDFIIGHFSRSDGPLVLAIEVEGSVITAPQMARPPVSERLIVSGGFSVDAALRLAATLSTTG